MMKTLTRLLLSLAVICCLFAQNTSAQNIPDPNFADAIRDVCPACIDANDNLTPAAQNLDSLDISGSGISNLAGIEGFINLKELSCSNNILHSLPDLPNSLDVLSCQHNQLDSLPALPNSLKYLECSFNQLIFLPPLPDSLMGLSCIHNQLDSLPALPNGLKYLECSYNQLIFLPPLPDSLIAIHTLYNQLESLPALPGNLTQLGCEYNPSLSCLPFLPNRLEALYTAGTPITCIPNQPPYLSIMNPVLPLCSEPCDSSVSTSNIFAAKPFTVQPNPVSEVLQVRFSADYEANADFRLLNSNGQIVRALFGKGDVEIPVGDLPEGIYWLEVRGARWIFGEKILKK